MFTFTSLSMANYWTAAFYFPKKCYYQCPRLIYRTLPTSLQYEAVQERKMENCLVSGLNWPFEVINGHKQALLFAHRDTVKTVFGLTSATTLRLKALAARLQWPSECLPSTRTAACDGRTCSAVSIHIQSALEEKTDGEECDTWTWKESIVY